MKKFLAFLLGCFFLVGSASAQSAFYYCNKGGKKLVSDRPCEEQGAKLTKKVRPEELYPISSGGSLSESARARVNQIDNRLRNEEYQHQQRMQAAAENYGWQQQNKKNTCDEPYREKEWVVSQQRQHSTPWLNERHRQINNRIYENGC